MRVCLSAILVLLIASVASAQFKQGDFEMSLLGTVGSMNEKREYSSSTGFEFDDDYDESHSYGYVSFMPAYYLIDGLAAELEIGIRAMEGVRPMQAVILNLGYTHKLPGSALALFGRVGYGLSNSWSIPVFLEQYGGASDKFDVNIINVGAGAKILVSRSAFIRAELNYRIQSYERDSGVLTTDYSYNTMALLFGVGLVL